MSLALEREGTDPKGVEIKTWGRLGGMADIVHLGKYEICIEDFLIAAHYVLTNTDIYPGDPRRQFVECIKTMELTEGYNKGGRHFRSPVPPAKGYL
jgi:hypothetical protein